MNLYQISNSKQNLEALKSVLNHGRSVLLEHVTGKSLIGLDEVLFYGSLCLTFARILGRNPRMDYSTEFIKSITYDFQLRAIRFNKGNLGANEEQSTNIDLKYARFLFRDWYSNKPINANDALYMGYMLMSFSRSFGVDYQQELECIETVERVALSIVKACSKKSTSSEIVTMAKLIEPYLGTTQN